MAPDFLHARHLLGLALARSGRAEEARPFLDSGGKEVRRSRVPDRLTERLAMYSASRATLLRESQGHLEGGRLVLATEILQSAARMYPEDLGFQALLGAAYVKDGRPHLALDPLRRALQEFGEDAPLRSNLATALLMLDLYQDAEVEADRAIALDPKLVEARITRARALRFQQRLEEAFRELQEIARLDPAHAAAAQELALIHQLGRALQEQGRLPRPAAAGQEAGRTGAPEKEPEGGS
jgi:Flp pilus assembly protein TadD